MPNPALTNPKKRDGYADLLSESRPKRIETQEEYNSFASRLEDLLGKEEDGDQLSSDENALVELLIIIIEEYEQREVSFPCSTPRDILLHLVEANEIKQSNLIGIIGSSGVVSEVMSGKRAISKNQAKKLGEFFQVSYTLFL